MAFAKIYSAQIYLLKPHLISVEIDLTRGLHSFSIVGLPDKAVEESRDRVSSAIKNSGFKSPKQSNIKIVVSLAPADIRKEGPAFDLPIAIGYLAAAGELSLDSKKQNSAQQMFVGELALNGNVRPILGALSFARLALENNFKEIFVPLENVAETVLVNGIRKDKNIRVFGVSNLSELVNHLKGVEKIKPAVYDPPDNIQINETRKNIHKSNIDFDDIIGQYNAKRALIIAAAGGHNIGLFGPPGTGKTMLARALQSVMPPLSAEQIIEVTEIYSAVGNSFDGKMNARPPIRSPHHTASHTSVIGGGGNTPKPGEITLAHHGILFMDEFPEFDRKVIEALRQPLEEKTISVSRVGGSAIFPANFILVAALNPCPCGNRGVRGKTCTCSGADIARYKRKLSGPLLDRIDMWIEVSKIDYKNLMKERQGSIETENATASVIKARKKQRERLSSLVGSAGDNDILNSQIDARSMVKAMKLSQKAKETLEKMAEKNDLSGRGFHRVIKLARTIADIADSETIETPHILEALQYREKILI